MKKMVALLNFSPRSDGNCENVCKSILRFYAESNIRSYSIRNIISPCGACDYECLKSDVHCPSLSREQAEVYEAVCRADLVYFVIPNFCGMPNSLYYAFNERSVGYFNLDKTVMSQYMAVKKRFIIVSNTESNIFTEAMRQQTMGIPEILYMKTGRYGKMSIAGDMMKSQEAQSDLNAFLAAGDI